MKSFMLHSSLSDGSCCEASGEEKGWSPASRATGSSLRSAWQGAAVCSWWRWWWTSVPAATNSAFPA